MNTKTEETQNARPTEVESTALLGLFHYSYDYHEWESLRAASFDREKLEAEHAKTLNPEGNPIAEDEEEHMNWAKREKYHWQIKPIDFLT